MEEIWRACMNMTMGAGGVLMMIAMILFWVGLLALVVLGIRWLWRQQGGTGRSRDEDPMEILRRRYAAGEIDHEEFERRRRSLQETSGRSR
jgi:putative membrane protein